MSSTSLSPDEIRAAAETHSELGPDYQGAVIESFLDKVGREIDARVDARLAASQQLPPARAQRASGRGGPLVLAIVSLGVGIPLTGITEGTHTPISGLVVIWLAIAVINVAYALSNRPPSR